MANADQLTAFIDRQRVLLNRERDTEIEQSALLLTNCGPKLLEQKGLAILGLGVVSINIGLGGKSLIELERPAAYNSSPLFPAHSFRPGDIARIEENSVGGKHKGANKKQRVDADKPTTSGKQVEGVVYKVSDARIILAVDPSDSGKNEELDLPERSRIVKLANSVTHDRMEKAVNQLERMVLPPSGVVNGAGNFTPPMTKLVEVLLGISTPSERVALESIAFFDQTLNESQKAAVKFALESPEVACIHGPPGTGKTHTLIEVIRQLTSVSPANPKPLRVLVCGASNLAVDNILERLLALPVTKSEGRLKVTRVGHPARVMSDDNVLDSTLDVKAGRSDEAALAKDVKDELEAALGILSGKGKGAKGKSPRGLERKKMWEEVRALRKEYRKREGGVVESVLSDSQIVVSTCHSSGGRQLYKHSFDVVIIDEATQAMEAVCWIPIFKAKKLILAGDPMQLPPTILSLNNHKKKKQDPVPTKSTNKKLAAPKTKSGPKDKSTTPEPPPVPIPQDEDQGVNSDESDEEGDAIMKDDDDVPPLTDVTTAETSTSGETRSTVVRTLRRGVLKPPRTLETTLFDRLERMYGPGIKRLLNVQYRMNQKIAEFPSRVMYHNKLRSHKSVASHLLDDLPNTSAEDADEAEEVLRTPVVFIDTAGSEYYERVDGDGDEGSRCNENEAMVVKKYIARLVDSGVLPTQIAVLTPYQAQVTLLASTLRPLYGKDIEIGTVDGMQGREKDAVVISLVRSNEKREVGFLKDKRRLNVAMTRAKRHLCVIGDSSTVKHGGSFLEKWMEWLEANADVRYDIVE